MKTVTKKKILFGVSIALIVIGAVMSGLWHTIFNNILKSQLQLSEDSTSFKLWKETPIPMYIEFYLFNCTNPNDVLNKGSKPHLKEMGPYIFSEEHSKVNITWNTNGTITFNQIRRWQYLPDVSKGSLEDNVTNLNVLSLATAFMGKKFSPTFHKFLDIFLRKEGSVWITKTVRELLFDGYDDKIIEWIKKLEKLLNISIPMPFDRFGWFYMRNGSWSYDGVFNMNTGSPSIDKLGEMHSWNYYTHVPFYDDHCADVNGSAGELWSPKETDDTVTMFVSDLCRSLTLDYQGESYVHGVAGRKYTAGKRIIDNATEYPDNFCFCRDQCFPSGIFDVSECKNGAPAYISYPNFYMADEFYLDKVEGMKPDKNKHDFQITLEPNTGIPLNVSAKLQINLHLQSFKSLRLYADVPDLFMPMIWFAQKAAITEDLTSQIRTLLIVPIAGTVTFYGILGIGILIAIIGILITLRGNWKGSEGVGLVNKDH